MKEKSPGSFEPTAAAAHREAVRELYGRDEPVDHA